MDEDRNDEIEDRVIALDDGEEPIDEGSDDDMNDTASMSTEAVDDESAEPEDYSLLQVAHHSSDVFCVDVHGDWVATGGHDDCAYIWRASTGEQIYKCEEHVDSVVQVSFNNTGTLLATGDMSGLIQVWTMPTKEGESVELMVKLDDVSDLQWLLWHNERNVLFAGGVDGCVWMWLVSSGQPLCRVFPPHAPSPATCGDLLADGKSMAVGYADGTRTVWTLQGQVPNRVELVSAQEQQLITGSVTCLAHSQGMLASGADDGIVLLIQPLNAKTIGLIQPPTPCEGVEAMAFNESGNMLAIGHTSGVTNVWQVSPTLMHMGECRHHEQSSIVKLLWTSDTVLCSVATDATIRLWDGRACAELGVLTGHTGEIFDMAYMKDDCKIVTAAADGTSRIFEVPKELCGFSA